MTPLNMAFTIIITVLMAVSSWGLGKVGMTRTSQKPMSRLEIRSDPVSLVSEAAMKIVEQADRSQAVKYKTQEDVDDKVASLKRSEVVLGALTADDFKDEVRLKNLENKLMPAPEDLKNLKTGVSVSEIGKNELLTILKPNPAVDPSFDVKVDNKSVEFVNLKEAKCWFSKEEMGEAPGEKSLVLAGTGASAVNWPVACKSPTEQQWLAAFKVGKPDFNDLEGRCAEYLDDGKVIGPSETAKGGRFESPMMKQARIGALRNMIEKNESNTPYVTDQQILDRAKTMAGKGQGMNYRQFLGPAKAALIGEARAEIAKRADNKASESYAYRWIISHPLP